MSFSRWFAGGKTQSGTDAALDFPGNWTKLNFSLTTSGATNCVGLDPEVGDPDVDCGKMGPHSHVCVKCAGEFVS